MTLKWTLIQGTGENDQEADSVGGGRWQIGPDSDGKWSLTFVWDDGSEQTVSRECRDEHDAKKLAETGEASEMENGSHLATPEEVDAAVEDIKREVKSDVLDGTVSASVSSFSDLHDYVDANTYGGLCDEGPESRASWGTASVVLVQDRVDAWLKQGGHHLLDADSVSDIGLDPTGRDGDPRFPYSELDLTEDELQRLKALHAYDPWEG